MWPKLLSLLIREKWAIADSYVDAYAPRVISFIKGEGSLDFSDLQTEKLTASYVHPDGEKSEELDNQTPENTVGIVNLSGVMTKFGGMCSYGTEDVAALLAELNANDSINAIILRIHSPGGTTSSVIPLKNIIAQINKPVIALVDSLAASAAYYTAVQCDKIIASDPLAEVGSIGTMGTIVNDDKFNEKEGYKVHRIYPPESSYKNKPAEEALKGNFDLIINESLSPWAKHFQEHVKQHRAGKFKEDIEGILQGKMFYATDALEYGLIDEIESLSGAIQSAFEMGMLHKKKTEITQLITN